MVFSDLDGTLLDAQTYEFRAAMPALQQLRQAGIPLVLVSSKTRAELEYWRALLGNNHPFVVENGGAVFVPQRYFPFPLAGAVQRDPYEVVELGRAYRELAAALDAAAAETGTQARAFHSMSVAEISRLTGLPRELARLARQREYDEPFQIASGEPAALLRALEKRGLRWSLGGRFYHLTGDHDKARAVAILIEAYRRAHGNIRTVGLGDSWNDIEFLRLTEVPIFLGTHPARQVKAALPGARIPPCAGPAGWNQAVLSLLAGYGHSKVVP